MTGGGLVALMAVALLLPLPAILLTAGELTSLARLVAVLALTLSGLASLILGGLLWLPMTAVILGLALLIRHRALPASLPEGVRALAWPLSLASLALSVLLIAVLFLFARQIALDFGDTR
jgi:hypothetical protein